VCCSSTGCPPRWVPARGKERRRLESESDGPAPFHWCVCRLTQGATRKERRLCHRFSGSIGNARMRARSGKNEPVSPKNKKNRPVVDVVIFWLRTHNRSPFSVCWAARNLSVWTFAASISVVARRPFCLLVYSHVYVVAVNKCHPFLWITLVYLAVSVPYRTNNRLHSVCGCGGDWWVTFCVFCARRSYPVYVHISSTRVAPAISRVIHSKPWITFCLAPGCDERAARVSRPFPGVMRAVENGRGRDPRRGPGRLAAVRPQSGRR
jgi:hypothetical protein